MTKFIDHYVTSFVMNGGFQQALTEEEHLFDMTYAIQDTSSEETMGQVFPISAPVPVWGVSLDALRSILEMRQGRHI